MRYSRTYRYEWQARHAATIAAANQQTIDESGANQPYLFTVDSNDQGTFDATATGTAGGAGQSVQDADDLTIIGTINDDSFNVDATALAAGALLDLDGGGGVDSLKIDFSALSIDFRARANGTIRSNYGTFVNFDSFDIKLGAGTNTVVTGDGNDRIIANGGTNTIDCGSGDDVVATVGTGNYAINGGAGVDTWTTSITKRNLDSIYIFDYHDNSGFLSTGTAITNVENIEILDDKQPLTFQLSGNFLISLKSIYVDGGLGPQPDTTIIADLTQIDQAVTINATGTWDDHPNLKYGLRILAGDFHGYFQRTDVSKLTGSIFDDFFSAESTYGFFGETLNWDGGDGFDTLELFLYDYNKLDDIRFVVHSDGTIDSNLGTYADFEQFTILAGDNSYIVGGDASDTFTAGGQLFGKDGDDILTGTELGTVLDGGAGNDHLSGDAADFASYQDAGQGVTVAVLTGAQDTIGAGIDTLIGIKNLTGSAFDDHLTGDDTANTIEGGGGSDVLIGGADIDTASYAGATSGVQVSLAQAGPQNTLGAGTDSLSRFENLTGSAFDDLLAGDAGDNTITGGDGNDRMSFADAANAVTVDLRIAGSQATGAGVDTLIGIEGIVGSGFDDTLTGDFHDNVIEGGAGNDVLDGTTGFDVASYAAATLGVTVDLRILTAQNTGGAGIDTLANFEAISGSGFGDILTGDMSNNRLVGGGGNDTLTGGRGSDELRGGNGDDLAVYLAGSWADYDVTAGHNNYAVASRANTDVDLLYAVERIHFGNGTFAIADTVNVGPNGVADKVTGVVEAGDGGPGIAATSGSVLTNDRDANLQTANLGETLEVTGIAVGRHPATFAAVHGDRIIEGRFGTLSIHADGSYDYTLDNDRAATDRLMEGKNGRDIFSYQLADAHGATSTASLTFIIAGAADSSAAHPASEQSTIEPVAVAAVFETGHLRHIVEQPSFAAAPPPHHAEFLL